MANARRNSRKNRRNSRKNRRNSRRNNVNMMGGRRRRSSSSRGLFRTLYGPVGQALGLTSNVVGTVTNTTRNVARKGIRGVNSVGLAVTGRANAAVRGLVSRKNRRNSRKSRRNSRRN